MTIPLVLSILLNRPMAVVQRLPLTSATVSPSGKLVVGSVEKGKRVLPCTWSPEDGIKMLPLPKDYDDGIAEGASRDGATIVGWLWRGTDCFDCVWIAGARPLIIVQNDSNGKPAISSDGRTVVGTTRGHGYTWTRSRGVKRLSPVKLARSTPSGRVNRPDLWTRLAWSGKDTCAASAVSGDGSVVAGSTFAPPKVIVPPHNGAPSPKEGCAEACVWRGGRQKGLGRPLGFYSTTISGVSEDGRTLCGHGYRKSGGWAFVWTTKGGLQPLPPAPEPWSPWTWGISGNGRIVYGSAARDRRDECFLWIDRGEPVTLAKYIGKGANGLGGLRPSYITAVSFDGRVLTFAAQGGDGKVSLWLASL